MKTIRRFLQVLLYYTALLVFLILSFVVNLMCLVLLLFPGSRRLEAPLRKLLQSFYNLWAWLMGFIGVLYLKTPERTPMKSSNGEIWVMNHPSLTDASYLFKFISNATCIYKHTIGWNPFYGAIARLANYIPNTSGLGIVRIACAGLAAGENLIVFPEGTRSTRVNLDNFKPGFALIAKRSEAPINVLWIESPDDFMTKGQPVLKVPSDCPVISIERIGRISPTDYDSTEDIMNEVKRQFEEKASEA